MKHFNKAEKERKCMYERFKEQYNPTLLKALQLDKEDIIDYMLENLTPQNVIDTGKKLQYINGIENKINNDEL